MKNVPAKISCLFYTGHHRAVIERTLDKADSHYADSDFPYVIGALTYLGRIDEAERLYLMKNRLMEPKDLIQCRYFLGLGFCRHSFYAKARRYFVENFRQRRLHLEGDAQFFIYQGLGFYHYFAGRMANALKNAEKALTASLSNNFLYGRAISMDLKGHTLIQTGYVGEGFQTLTTAEGLATQLGASWLSEAIRVSMLSYKSRFGIDGNIALKELNIKLSSLSKEDIYSQSTVLLDLAQEHLRRGMLSEARENLNDCCRIVYASQNRRHAALLNLRYAYAHYAEGETHLALNLVRNALTQIDPEVDVVLELRLSGFEERLIAELKINVDMKSFTQKIERLTRRIGEAIGQRIMLRQHSMSFSSQRLGQDPFGDLLDLIRREPQTSIEAILKTGYYGLLPEVLSLERNKRILYLDLEPGSLTIFDQGNILHFSNAISRSLRSVLLQLNTKVQTKAELISSIWGYEYHPLRHDALIYSTITKIRKILGKRSHWLEVSEQGYQLRSGVTVLSQAEAAPLVEVPVIEEDSIPSVGVATPTFRASLNHRQQKILRYLEQNEFIDTMTCTGLFETSEVTASRDLSELLKFKFVKRMGKGRATKYTRGFSENDFETNSRLSDLESIVSN